MRFKTSLLWMLTAAASFAILAASSPQCVNSADVSGPELATLAKKRDCERDCRADRREAIRDERKRHRLALRECREEARENDSNLDPACVEEEEAEHQANLADIEEDFQDCLTACAHQQGTGVGGQ